MTTSDIFRNQRPVWKEYKTLFVLARRALPFILGLAIGGIIFSNDPGYITNLYTEVLSIAATVGILDYLNDQRRKQELEDDLKQRLIRDAGSRSNDIAIKAIEELRAHGYLTGEQGLLKSTSLLYANLSGANLKEANLSESNLGVANLAKARLSKANLAGAKLSYSDLSGANLTKANLSLTEFMQANLSETKLWEADLSESSLLKTNLSGANLFRANLSKAKLWDADLTGADLYCANLDDVVLGEEVLGVSFIATLPDGTKWTHETDMRRFTDYNHPEFEATREKIKTIREEIGLTLFETDLDNPFTWG